MTEQPGQIIEGRRLGRRPIREDPRTLRLGNYLTSELPLPPASVDWSANATYAMYLNDKLGDCTFAAVGNMVRTWTAADSTEVDLSDQDILTAYEAVSGYNPRTGDGDNGAVELDVLRYWQRRGVGGHTIAAYAKVSLTSRLEIKTAIHLFGGIYIGIALPVTAQTETGPGKIWRNHRGADGKPGSWGLHAVPVAGYDPDGLDPITWGQRQRMAWSFWGRYVEEAYAIVPTLDWTGPDGRTPTGLDLAALKKDLAVIA